MGENKLGSRGFATASYWERAIKNCIIMMLPLRTGGAPRLASMPLVGLGPIGLNPEPTTTAPRAPSGNCPCGIASPHRYVAYPVRSFLKSLATAT